MAKLEELTRGATVKGILPDALIMVVDVQWHGDMAITLTYRDAAGRLGNEILYRDREPSLEIATVGLPWSFDGDGTLLRLVSEAYRIHLAYLFDPLLAVHTSLVEPLPHQITAVYSEMLPRQPLRFLLADDPGSGKTIMTGLFIKELLIRGDLHRCLVVCPGSLVEQWQDELNRRFHLPFEIITNDRLESARSGNAFAETNLAICRLDKRSRNEDTQAKLEQTDWDLIVVDEAHKMSASFFGGEVKYTKRYRLGQMLSRLTRHFLLLTATPHNGKEADFQLFLALLDGDRFEGRFRDAVHTTGVSDLKRLREEQFLKRGAEAHVELAHDLPALTTDDLDDLDDAPDEEVEVLEEQVVDQASAARTIRELEAEIAILARLEALAQRVRSSGTDRKWEELGRLLQNNAEMFEASGARRKLVIFTEHRDTLNYLTVSIRTLLGRPEAVVIIHGGIGREERRHAQEQFLNDPEALVLVATDAAGEGINLQRAHLMVNYDLPWNPNRLEQRFGRIHRIGQTEVCHLWNLVAEETREGEVWKRLLEKLEEERKALGGGVFDILGRVRFENQPLRELVLQAIRYGDQPEVRARLNQAVDNALDRERLRELLEERALARDTLDASQVRAIREEMERAEARRLQPHFIADFFLAAFKLLGGSVRVREAGRYEITHVPAVIRTRDRQIGTGEAVLPRYERITFEKALISVPGKPLAAFVCPGHPLLDATIDLVLERYRDLLKRGAVLVDPNDSGEEPRALVYLEHAIQDARTDRAGHHRVVSRQMQFVELDAAGTAHMAGYAPYLDYRPLLEGEHTLVEPVLNGLALREQIEQQALNFAITALVPQHLAEVKGRKEELIRKTMAAVKDRLTKEINYWDHRAAQLRRQEEAGKTFSLNSAKARQRADEMQTRLQRRMEELEQERQISALPPIVTGGVLVIPAGLLAKLRGQSVEIINALARETWRIELAAMEAVMAYEHALGFVPRDGSAEKCGYDIESQVPGTGKLRFIEVKGRVVGADTVTLTKNEILTALNKPDEFILAIVEVDGDIVGVPSYISRPFTREPDFGVTSVTYAIRELLSRAEIVA